MGPIIPQYTVELNSNNNPESFQTVPLSSKCRGEHDFFDKGLPAPPEEEKQTTSIRISLYKPVRVQILFAPPIPSSAVAVVPPQNASYSGPITTHIILITPPEHLTAHLLDSSDEYILPIERKKILPTCWLTAALSVS